MRGYERGTKAALSKILARGVRKAHFCSQVKSGRKWGRTDKDTKLSKKNHTILE